VSRYEDPRVCAKGMREAGLPAPRTCPTCKLGPCAIEAPKETNLPAQASDEPMPFPPMPLPVVKHAVVGDLFDCFAMQQYALRYADLVVAALKAQPAPTEAPRPDLSKFVTVKQWQLAMSQWSLNKALGKNLTEAQGEDSARLNALLHASWNLECFNMATGGGDYEIGWRVFEHHESAPLKRTVAEVYEDNPRAAIDRARASAETGGVKS
jgi:hypothetical protein